MAPQSRPAAEISLELRRQQGAEKMARAMVLVRPVRVWPKVVALKYSAFVVALPVAGALELAPVAASQTARPSVAEHRPFDAARSVECS